MKQKIQAIVFDFDGVVIDSEPLYRKAEEKFFAEYGVTIPSKDWKQFKGLSEEGFFKLASEKYGISAHSEELRNRSRELFLEEIKHNLRYLPGFEEFFEDIKNKYRIGLVTSTPRLILEWIFCNTEIKNHFEYIITADDVKKRKPDPEPYLEICKKMNVKPEQVIVIEDSINGVNSAVAAGAITIGFTTSLSEEDLNAANFFAKSYDEIRKIIDAFM